MKEQIALSAKKTKLRTVAFCIVAIVCAIGTTNCSAQFDFGTSLNGTSSEVAQASSSKVDRSAAVNGIQSESDAMRVLLIELYRDNAKFGKLISTNAKIKGSARRLAEKLNQLNVDWDKEAKEIDQLIFDLESQLEEANFRGATTKAVDESALRLGNMLSLAQAIKDSNRPGGGFLFDMREPNSAKAGEVGETALVGETGLTDNDIENFFEADFEPSSQLVIKPNESAPSFPPTITLEPAPGRVNQPTLRGRDMIDRPLVMDGREIPATSVLENPTLATQRLESPALSVPEFNAPALEAPNLDFGSPSEVMTMPDITRPAPGVVNQSLKPQIEFPENELAINPDPLVASTFPPPRLIAPQPNANLGPRVTRSTFIETYTARPVYVPYGGYGGFGVGPYGYGSRYIPYGGYSGRGPAPRRHPHYHPGNRPLNYGAGGFSIRVGGINFRF